MTRTVIQALYTSVLRDWARRLGVLKLAQKIVVMGRSLRPRPHRFVEPGIISFHPAGVEMRAHASDEFELSRALAMYDDASLFRALRDRARPGECVWDVGANVGMYSIVLGRAVGEAGTVVAFEPEPRAVVRLHENLRLNCLQNVRVQGCALSDAKATSVLHVAAAPSAGTHSLTSRDGQSEAGAVQVELESGDDLVGRGVVPAPNVMKIDVEGMECRVLDGLAKTMAEVTCHTVFVEVHSAILRQASELGTPKGVVARLARAGFRRLRWLDASHVLATRDGAVGQAAR